MPNLVPIVEGKGDVGAVPLLVRRILHEVIGRYDIGVAHAIRLSRGKIVKPHELERALILAQTDRPEACAALVVFDEDDDDAATLEGSLERHLALTAALPTRVRVAVREYEAWLLAGKESLRGHQGIRFDAVSPTDPERLRDAKGEIQANMVAGRKYIETSDQEKLTAVVDLAAAGTCASFQRLVTAVRELVNVCAPHP